jgi:cytochrome b involved in lipid metabolism
MMMHITEEATTHQKNKMGNKSWQWKTLGLVILAFSTVTFGASLFKPSQELGSFGVRRLSIQYDTDISDMEASPDGSSRRLGSGDSSDSSDDSSDSSDVSDPVSAPVSDPVPSPVATPVAAPVKPPTKSPVKAPVAPPTPAPLRLTASEVAKHSKAMGDCWTIIAGNVYDQSGFTNHPVSGVVEGTCGADGTGTFGTGHGSDYGIMKNYLVGPLVE